MLPPKPGASSTLLIDRFGKGGGFADGGFLNVGNDHDRSDDGLVCGNGFVKTNRWLVKVWPSLWKYSRSVWLLPPVPTMCVS